jgi:hypothetical protein
MPPIKDSKVANKADEIEVKLDKIGMATLKEAHLHEWTRCGLVVAFSATYLLTTLFLVLYIALGTYDQQRLTGILTVLTPLNGIMTGILGFYIGRRVR